MVIYPVLPEIRAAITTSHVNQGFPASLLTIEKLARTAERRKRRGGHPGPEGLPAMIFKFVPSILIVHPLLPINYWHKHKNSSDLGLHPIIYIVMYENNEKQTKNDRASTKRKMLYDASIATLQNKTEIDFFLKLYARYVRVQQDNGGGPCER
jgi:hypothetical protein